MAKRCPPGVICIENITVIFLIVVLCLTAFIWYKFSVGGNCTSNNRLTNQKFINITEPSIPKFNSIVLTSLDKLLFFAIFLDSRSNLKERLMLVSLS